MAAYRLSRHDQAGSEELDPSAVATACPFLGTADGERHGTREPRPEQAFRIRPRALAQPALGQGRAQNVQIRTTPVLSSRERTTAQIGG